jgi:two-component system cell cycle sensor histidine kinase/response regulator CckA
MEKRIIQQISRLKKLSELSIGLTGEPIDIFQRITSMIAELLDVPVVNISEIRHGKLVHLSSFVHGKATPFGGTCLLRNTPCATVEETKDIRVYQNVKELFPEAEFLKQYNAHTYCGFPAFDATGNVVAVICLLDDKPHEFSEEDKYLMKIVAQRVGAEIERQKILDERKKLEAQLRQSLKMEAIGRFAGGIAHDFNNILSVIVGYTEMLLVDLPPDDPSAERINMIRQAGEKAAALTHQLLAFSRKQVLALRVFDLNTVIENMTKMLARIIGEDIMLELHTRASAGTVMADSGQLEQVLMNLAVNARDAMPSGGRLTIETADVVLDEGYTSRHEEIIPGRYVMLAVSDNGVGMSKEVQEMIFEPFFTTKVAGIGTGLGLAMIYGIIKQHNGYIYVYSEPGKGTTFKIYLPAIQKDLPEADREHLPLLRGKETVFVVDDDPLIRKLVVDMLTPLGYRLREAENGEAALESAAGFQGRIEMLLTDVIMPGMNGKELAKAFLERHPETKVIFMSGDTSDAVPYRDILGKETAFIQKPLTLYKLANKLREVLDQNGKSE